MIIPEPLQGWVGVVEDTMDLELYPRTHDDAYCRFYATQREAKKHYECIARVLIVVLELKS